jgi:hypothetical protein
LLRWFSTFGVPEELSTDGGPPFNSMEYDSFLMTWDVRKRLSSAHYPQSNGRAEATVKTIKRILLGNVNRVTGEIDTDTAAAAIMTHRNTPSQSTGVSPAVTLFGRPIRDHLPDTPRELRPEWRAILKAREQALAKRHLRITMAPARKQLQPLKPGDSVSIQNQRGNKPKKWNSTGTIAEALPNRQYQVVVDGSRHVTLRKRRFLREIDPVCRQPKSLPAPSYQSPTNVQTNPIPPGNDRVQEDNAGEQLGQPSSPQAPRVELTPTVPHDRSRTSPPQSPMPGPSVEQPSPTSPQVAAPQPLRRSTRSTKGKPPERLDL